jgi:hypothetical protein
VLVVHFLPFICSHILSIDPSKDKGTRPISREFLSIGHCTHCTAFTALCPKMSVSALSLSSLFNFHPDQRFMYSSLIQLSSHFILFLTIIINDPFISMCANDLGSGCPCLASRSIPNNRANGLLIFYPERVYPFSVLDLGRWKNT